MNISLPFAPVWCDDPVIPRLGAVLGMFPLSGEIPESSMPRYFFHIHDGNSVLDDVGLELPDIFAARTTAIELSGEILKNDVKDPLMRHVHWQVEVSDSPKLGGRSLFLLQFSVAP